VNGRHDSGAIDEDRFREIPEAILSIDDGEGLINADREGDPRSGHEGPSGGWLVLAIDPKNRSISCLTPRDCGGQRWHLLLARPTPTGKEDQDGWLAVPTAIGWNGHGLTRVHERRQDELRGELAGHHRSR
jgi:hypothetical protein